MMRCFTFVIGKIVGLTSLCLLPGLTLRQIWEDGNVIFFMKINLSNLPEERHAGFNNWLRVFVGSVVTC